MEKEIQKAVEEHQKKIAELMVMDEDLKIAKEIMGEKSMYLDYEINYSWGCNSIAEIKDILKKFAKVGIMLKDVSNAESTNPTWRLKGKNCIIRICPYWYSSEDEGRTCRLVQVGEETRTYPKYKLMCDGKEVASPYTEV